VVAALNISSGATVNNPAEASASEKPISWPNSASFLFISTIKNVRLGKKETRVSIDSVSRAPA
jgi:hypothetical protein